jgi:hypothetical protein
MTMPWAIASLVKRQWLRYSKDAIADSPSRCVAFDGVVARSRFSKFEGALKLSARKWGTAPGLASLLWFGLRSYLELERSFAAGMQGTWKTETPILFPFANQRHDWMRTVQVANLVTQPWPFTEYYRHARAGNRILFAEFVQSINSTAR